MSKHPTTRAERRAAAYRRQKAQTRKYRRQKAWMTRLQPHHFIGGVVPDVEALVRKLGRLNRDDRQPCSCPFCGNPRRHFGTPPIGERREPPVYLEDLPIAYLSLGPGGLRVTFPEPEEGAE